MAFINRKNSVNSKAAVLFFTVVSIICFLLSSSVLPFFADGKNAPVPELLLCLACVLPIYMGRKEACIFALVLGFVSDLFINEPASLSPIIFVLAVLFTMVMGRYFSRLGTLSIAVCTLPVLAVRMVADTVCYLIRFNDSELFGVITSETFPGLLVNFATAIVLTFTVRYFAKRFKIFALE